MPHRDRATRKSATCSKSRANISPTGATRPADANANPSPASAPRSALKKNTKGTRPPKNTGTGETLAPLLRAFSAGVSRHDCATRYAAQALVDIAGSTNPRRLSAAHVIEAAAACAPANLSPFTRNNRLASLRRILRSLWEDNGAPKLDSSVPRTATPRPRAVTATREEIDALKTHAPADLRLFIALCADLAIRSGTAVRISPAEYDPARGTLRFTTKKGARVAIPVTAEVAGALRTL